MVQTLFEIKKQIEHNKPGKYLLPGFFIYKIDIDKKSQTGRINSSCRTSFPGGISWRRHGF